MLINKKKFEKLQEITEQAFINVQELIDRDEEDKGLTNKETYSKVEADMYKAFNAIQTLRLATKKAL